MRIRPARPDDAAAIARVHVDSWRTTYAGLVPADHLAGLSYERFEDNWRRWLTTLNSPGFYLVAQDSAGEVVGFAAGGPERDGRDAYRGELYALYLLMGHQRQGLGRALTAETARRLVTKDITSLLVWVLAANPSRGFYEALGGVLVAEKDIEIGGATLREVAYGWQDLRPLLSSPKSQAPD